ncbi:HNH endonuclease signature motif containing protein [Demequina litorisediminis]|uniref:HNH endonuclease signature motif containing protein n=1 Tax=Demequina litorisediminis TaxID=1849022 RepID=UPI0024E0557B|nr:HNH endonuclease signature motif containing protein [Demequina litorisediminis]
MSGTSGGRKTCPAWSPSTETWTWSPPLRSSKSCPRLSTTEIRKQGRQEDPAAETRTVGQIRADALHTLARHALGCTQMHQSGFRTTLVVRVDQRVRERGEGVGSIDGIATPVSFEAVRLLNGDAGIIAEILDDDGNVLRQGRRRRGFTFAQRVALAHRDGGCARCGAPVSHCEAHHIRWWEHGGATDIDNGVLLCTRCHHDVHRYGWRIDVIGGTVTFTPPGGDDATAFVGGNAALAIDLDPPPRDDWETFRDDALIAEWLASTPERFDDPYPSPEEHDRANALLHA